MKSVRTTLALPKPVYQVLRDSAFSQQKSFGEVVANWYYQANQVPTPTSQKQGEDDLDFFQKVGRSGKNIDLTKTLREDRDRDV